MTVTTFSSVATDTSNGYLSISNSRSFVGGNQADITFNHGIIDFLDLTAHPTDRGYPTTDITSWTLADGKLTFYVGTTVAAQFGFHDLSPEAANGSNLHIGRVAGNTGLYLTEGTSYGPGNLDVIPGTIVNPTSATTTSQTINGTSSYIYAPTDPTNFIVQNGGSLELGGVINPADTISVTGATLKIDDVRDSGETIVFNDGVIDLDGLAGSVDGWSLQNGVLSMISKGQAIAHFKFTDASPEAGKTANIEISQSGTGTYITEGTLNQPSGATVLPGNLAQPQPVVTPAVVTPPVTQPTPQNVAVHDTTTNADLPDTSTAYNGPVAGITSQFIAIMPDSLNVTAMADNLFIHTSGGNDAVALHGGTNVVDAGTGSNFLTSGGGFDTFFLDARNIPAATSAAGPVPGAVWDTIQNFGHSDAVTIFGIGPGTALDWQANQGAVGHTGLTLHANTLNGSEASLTLAGIDSKAGLQLSYGSVAGSSYLYIKAA